MVALPQLSPLLSESELFGQRLLGKDRPVQPTPPKQSSITDIEVMLQCLLPGGSSAMERQPPEDER